MELQVERVVAAPVAAVWAVITDIGAFATVLQSVDKVERMDDGTAFDVGATWRETRTMFGKQAIEQLEVTQIDPPHRYTVTAINGPTTYTSVLATEPIDTQHCRLIMSFHAATASTMVRVIAATIGRLFAGATRKVLARDAEDIATAVETRHADERPRDTGGTAETQR